MNRNGVYGVVVLDKKPGHTKVRVGWRSAAGKRKARLSEIDVNTKPNPGFLGLVCFNINQTQDFWVWFGRRGGLGGSWGVLGVLGGGLCSWEQIK